MTRSEFVKYITKLVLDYRKTATKEPDFFDSVTIAQAIHETGYGTSGLYKDYNNAFGYKAKVVNGVPEWDGKVAENYKSDEEIDGVVHKKVESDFRWYDSVEESVADHANMMTRLNGRYLSTYRKALDAKTPKEQAHALTESYAGDSRYAKKLIEVMDEWNLYQYDTEKEETTMTLKTRKQLVPLRTVNHGGRNNRKLNITIHQTGNTNAGANAQMHANYQSNNTTRYASWHWQVDGKEAIQSFEHNVSCYHASDGTTRGGGNMDSIGIEGCINRDGDYNKSVENMARLSASLCKQYKLDPYKNIKRHYDFDTKNRKWCPAQIMNGKNGITWNKFLDMVAKYLKELDGVSSHNPQGLPTMGIPAYTSPSIPFDKLEVGQTVTIRSPFNWYDPSDKVFIKPSKDFSGTTDKIAEIKDIEDVGYSSIAYRLEKYNSWILEQDIVEARNSWAKVEPEPVEEELEDIPEKDDPTEGITKEAAKLPEGVFYLDGEMFKVEKAPLSSPEIPNNLI